MWLCHCDCGNSKVIRGVSLRNGNTKGCGCIAAPDHTGKRFGGLVVLKKLANKKSHSNWLCKCDCGATTKVTNTRLVSGATKSCGCGRKSLDGLSTSSPREYRSWRAMLARCNNPETRHYEHYGGRGIKVCDRWLDFTLFLKDMGRNPGRFHTLDKQDNNGNYEPGNCAWVDKKAQARNTRRNFILSYKGKKKCLAEWCELLGLKYHTVYCRLRNGWSVQSALEEPKKVNQFSE